MRSRSASTSRAPAAGPRGTRRARIRWDRVGRTALLIVLGAILLLYVQPVTTWFEQSGTADRQRAELERLQREHEQLRDRVAGLSGPEALEREARRLGMVRADERAIVIENLPAP